ncbi:MAG TPA: hypothetical protein VHA14_10035 [Bryobacteraceae bacterium]|nr:hypothetical protein [Bryobacteraceae bacterium]
MRRIAQWMIRLYPASWRARYGEELDALLSDTGADARIVGDLARGGMRMQMKAWPFALLAVMLGVAGLLAGAGISLFVPNVYVSEAVMRMDTGLASTDRLDIERAQEEVISRRNLSRIITERHLYSGDLAVEPMSDVIDEMRRAIQIDPIRVAGNGTAFRIQFEYGDRLKAQQATAALAESFRNEIPNLSRWKAGLAQQRLSVLGIPSLPDAPVFPRKTVLMEGGFLAGVLIAARLRAVLRTRWLHNGFVVVAAIAGIAAMVLASFGADLWPNYYRSTATLWLTAPQSEVTALIAETRSLDFLSLVANDPHLQLYPAEMNEQPVEEVLRRMREHVSVNYHSLGSGVGAEVTLAFDYYDRLKARQAVQTFIGKFEDLAARRLAKVPGGTTTSTPVIEILEGPSLPQSPVKPNRYAAGSTGAGCGVLLAGIVSLLRRRWKPSQHALPL